MANSDPIRFYAVKGAYGCFSNFAPYPIWIRQNRWPTTEHYFQAQKFAGTPWEEEVRHQPTPGAAARMGRRRDLPLRADWEEVKDDVMRRALAEKFHQHPFIRSVLLETGNVPLIEHTVNDRYWGDGGDGSGKNMLGKLLMELREQLRADGYTPGPATRDVWKNEPMSSQREKLPLHNSFSDREMERIRFGFVPEEMEEKWFIHWEDPWLHFHRSWTGHEIFMVRIERVTRVWQIAEAYASRDTAQYQSDDATADCKRIQELIRVWLLGKSDPD